MNINSKAYLLLKKVIEDNPTISAGDMGRLINLIYHNPQR